MKTASAKRLRILTACHLAVLTGAGCFSAVESDPVSLPVPFSGSLVSDSRVVIVDGKPDTASSTKNLKNLLLAGKSFVAASSTGENVGRCFYDESKIGPAVADGAQTSFSMPVCLEIDLGDVVCAATARFVELPFEDPTRDLCALIPAGEDCKAARFVRGAASGIITSGQGSFGASVGKATLEHRFVAVVKGEGQGQKFLNFLEGVWILNR
jgi:hypothetical protein